MSGESAATGHFISYREWLLRDSDSYLRYHNLVSALDTTARRQRRHKLGFLAYCISGPKYARHNIAFLFLIWIFWHHLSFVDKTLKHSPVLSPGNSHACVHVARLSACPAQTDSSLWCVPGPSQVLSVLPECASHSHIYLVCLFGEKSRLDKFLTPNSHGPTTIFIQMTKPIKPKISPFTCYWESARLGERIWNSWM